MTRKPAILIIEDNPVDALLINEILTDFGKGFELLWAECLADGISQLTSNNQLIDAILLDLSLSDSTGFETFEKVYALVPHIPVIILTGLDDEEMGMNAVQHGAQDYLVKNQVTGQLLVRSIRYAIERKQTELKLMDVLEQNKKIFSARMLAEETFRDSQKRYQSLFGDSPIPIWEEDFSSVKMFIDKLKTEGVTDFKAYFEENPHIVRDLSAQIKVLGINKAVLELHNAESKEQLMNNSSIIFNKDSYQILAKEFALIAEGLTLFDLEQQILTLSNKQKFVILRLSVPAGYETSLSRVLISVIDITERKLAEDSLQMYRNQLEDLVKIRTQEMEIAQHRTELIFNAVGEGIYGIDRNGLITFINPVAVLMIGLETSDILDKHQNSVFRITRANLTPYPLNESPVELTCKDGLPRYITDDMFCRKDDSFFPVEYICTPIRENKQLVGAVIVFNDITLRKLAELEVKQSEERYRLLADNLNDVIWTVDLAGNFMYISPSVKRQTGYTASEAKKLTLSEIFTPASVIIAETELTKIAGKIRTGEMVSGNLELEQYRNDGSVFWTEISYNLMYDDNNKLLGVLGISRDITDRKHLIEELQKAKIAAESATQTKSEFLANMSHEIRTPMNTIIGFSDLLYASVENEKQRLQVQSIYTSAQSLLGIINDILDLSKIEAGKFKIQYLPVNLKSLIKDVENIFAQKMRERGLAFFIDYDFEIPETLMLDEVRLRQILFNLIGNAVKFTEEGYISIDIEMDSKVEDRINLILSVEDTGIGVPPDQQELIFEAFSQQKGQNTKKYGGTGLGLTITRRLVEMMGGDIILKSEPGTGSTFQIVLKEVEISDEKVVHKEEIVFNPKSVVFGPATILLCDDSQTSRKLIIDLLENSPLNIIEATDGKEAVDLASTHIPALILMDLKMPVISGKEAAQELKAKERTKNIPIIAVSASAKVSIPDEELKSYFDDLIMKPVKIAEVVELLKKYLPFKIQTVIKPEQPEIVEVKLPGGLKGQLSQLLQKLEQELLPMYQEAIQNQRIDQMENFGNALKQLGNEYQVESIIVYGNKICGYTDSFETEKLLLALQDFPSIMSKLKSQRE